MTNSIPQTQAHPTFRCALRTTLRFEGGENSDIDDPGNSGGTKTHFGITQSTYDAWRTSHALPLRETQNLEPSEVRALYYELYWKPSGAEKLPPGLALLHFDSSVNHGVSRALSLLKTSSKGTPNGSSQSNWEEEIRTRYLNLRMNLYDKLAEARWAKKYIHGWKNRLNTLARLITQEEPCKPVH